MNRYGGWRGWLLLAFVCGALGCGEAPPASESGMPPGALGPLPTVTFALAGEEVTAEVAITMQQQRQGLMYRDSMPANHGMLFVYREPQYLSFWMKNTRIPLSIAFIRPDGRISNIEEMEPHRGPFEPTQNYVSRYRCLYALEMNAGWFARHGVNAGDTIALPTPEIEAMAREALGS